MQAQAQTQDAPGSAVPAAFQAMPHRSPTNWSGSASYSPASLHGSA